MRKWDERREQRLTKMRADGCTFKEIGDSLGFDAESTRKHWHLMQYRKPGEEPRAKKELPPILQTAPSQPTCTGIRMVSSEWVTLPDGVQSRTIAMAEDIAA